jgi:hypothetical protein
MLVSILGDAGLDLSTHFNPKSVIGTGKMS